jgi:hypothetical protein
VAKSLAANLSTDGVPLTTGIKNTGTTGIKGVVA